MAWCLGDRSTFHNNPGGAETSGLHIQSHHRWQPTLSFASAVGSPLMSRPLLLQLEPVATPCSQYGKPSPLLLLLLALVDAAAAPLPLLLLGASLLLLLLPAGSTTRLMSSPNFTANS
jgi:hypothetical protein